MANGKTEAESQRPIRKQEKTRKPYIKPAFRFEQVFVTSALSCGKIDDTSFLCITNRKLS